MASVSWSMAPTHKWTLALTGTKHQHVTLKPQTTACISTKPAAPTAFQEGNTQTT